MLGVSKLCGVFLFLFLDQRTARRGLAWLSARLLKLGWIGVTESFLFVGGYVDMHIYVYIYICMYVCVCVCV